MYHTIDQIEFFLDNRSNVGIKPGLDRVKVLLRTVGNPEKDLSAIHVAGTNGKGSTIAFMSQALQQNGYQTGMFISPSFHGLNGHILLNGLIMPENDFVTAFNKLEPALYNLNDAGDPPTTFEIVTVVAFMYFARHTNIALIEAGMGGRYDTTNVLEPILSIITNVSYDHTAYLGSTIQAIASHKAGIIKSHTPVVAGELSEEAESVVNLEAKQKQACLYELGKAFTYTLGDTENSNHYLWKSGTTSFSISTVLKGKHQIKNSALAMMALMLLNDQHVSLSWAKVLDGLANAQLPGRYERVHQSPTIIVDGAHNPAGINAFLQTVATDTGTAEKTLLFAAFRDKDIQAMLNSAAKVFDNIILTTFDHQRAANETDYEQLKHISTDLFPFEPSWHKALTNILQEGKTDRYYYVVGSLHFIEKVRNFFASLSET